MSTEESTLIYTLKDRMIPVFECMGLCTRSINDIPVRFGEDNEFRMTYSMAYTDGYKIVLRKNTTFYDAMSNLSHEIGHIVTVTGKWTIVNGLVAEITAYNFQKRFIKEYNNVFKANLEIKMEPFLKSIIISYPHAVGWILSFIPLSKVINHKYKSMD